MKVIGLMPVRNESWILRITLEVLSEICDSIIVADQASDDDTREICKDFASVVLIHNKETGHSNKVRWQLLDAARSFDGNNLLLSIDADEIIPPSLFKESIARIKSQLVLGQGLEFLWVQLWKSPNYWRDDKSVWSNNWKTVAFLDDRKVDYDRDNVVINDHTSRVPRPANVGACRLDGVPLLHLQWAAWERAQLKQAWYRCAELLNGINPKAINDKYAITLDDPSARLSRVPSAWLEGIQVQSLKAQMSIRSSWHLNEIVHWFDQRGVEFFEPLEIWHVPQLREEFHRRTRRMPRLRTSGYLGKLVSRFRNMVV